MPDRRRTRDLGFPKLASPKVCHENETLVRTLHYGTVLCVTATMGYKHREIDHGRSQVLARPNFMIKIIRTSTARRASASWCATTART